MTYRALFLDIDGTILTYDHTFTELTKKAIEEVQKVGVDVFIATGRPLHEINNLRKELGIQSAIGYNGAFAIHKNKVIVDYPMNEELVQKVITTAEEYDNDLVLYTAKKNYFTSLSRTEVVKFINFFQLKENEQLDGDLNNPIYSMTVMNCHESYVPAYKTLNDLVVSTVNVEGIENSYDLIQKNINKGTAVQMVLDTLGIPNDEAIAFGDGMNDKEMLQTVGTSFVMANGDPNLFQYAKYETKSVDESGIYYGLQKLGLVK